MKKLKKSLSLLLALVMVLSCMSVGAMATNTTIVGPTYDFANNRVQFVMSGFDNAAMYDLRITFNKDVSGSLEFFIDPDWKTPIVGSGFTANTQYMLLENIAKNNNTAVYQSLNLNGSGISGAVINNTFDGSFPCGVTYTSAPAGTTMTVEVMEKGSPVATATCVLNPVAKIGDTGYATLQAAFEAAINAGTATINVIADCELASPVSIPTGKDITLNLGNGVTVSTSEGIEVTSSANGVNLTSQNACGVTVIDNKGTLTITGEGTIDATSINAIESAGLTQYLINNEGTLTLNGGTFKLNRFIKSTILRSSGTATLNNCDFDAWCALLNDDGGQMTINGGTYTGWAFAGKPSNNPGGYRYAVAQYGETSKMTINGGKVYGIHGAVGVSVGELVINDGYFETRNPGNVSDGTTEYTPSTFYVLYTAGERGKVSATVYGGTFVNKGTGRVILVGNTSDGGIGALASTNIYGGTFMQASNKTIVKVNAINGNGGKIYGGTFYGSATLFDTSGLTVPDALGDNCAVKEVGSSVAVDGVTYTKMYVVGKAATKTENETTTTATVTESKNSQNDTVYTIYKENAEPVVVTAPTLDKKDSITNTEDATELIDVAGALAEAAANGATITEDSTFAIEVVKGDVPAEKPTAASPNVIEVHPELITTTGIESFKTEISNSNLNKALTFNVDLGTEYANKTVTLVHWYKDSNDDWQQEAVDGQFTADGTGKITGVTLEHFSLLDPTEVSSQDIDDTVYGYISANDMFLYDSIMFHTYVMLTEAGEAKLNDGIKVVVEYDSDPSQNAEYLLKNLSKTSYGDYDITVAVRPRHLYKTVTFKLQDAEGNALGVAANSNGAAASFVEVNPNSYLDSAKATYSNLAGVIDALRAYADAAVAAWGDGPKY